MPAEKRKHVDAFEGSPDQRAVVVESGYEDGSNESEVNKPSKKRKTAYSSHWFSEGDASSATLSRSPPPPVYSESEVPSEKQLQLVQKPPTPQVTTPESEDPWGTDRESLRRAVLGLWEKYRTSVDGSIDEALSRLVGVAADLKDHPGRSPAYKILQVKKVGKSPLLNLPGEIRNVIWQFANLPQVSCCMTGTKCHDNQRARDLKVGDWDWSLIRALVGRGIPVHRQVLCETRGVATPVGARFCSWTCASIFTFRIEDAHKPARLSRSWQRGRLWREIQKLEVDMQSEMKNRPRRFGPQGARSKIRERFDNLLLTKLNRGPMAGAKLMSYTVGDTYVLEKIPNEAVQEVERHDD